MQKSRGSSCLGSPVRGSKNGSPPGLSGGKFLLSKIVAFERPRVAPGRYVGHWYVPLKSGLPSVVRGIFVVAVFCAQSGVMTVSAPSASISKSERVYLIVIPSAGLGDVPLRRCFSFFFS